MNPVSRLLAACTLSLSLPALTSDAFAHPPDETGKHPGDHTHAHPDSVRNWTNAKTGEIVRGGFLAAKDGRVSIERLNGDIVVFEISDLAPADQAEIVEHVARIKKLNEGLPAAATPTPNADRPPQAAPFDAFAPFVATRWDKDWLYIESDGLPHTPGGKPGSYVYSHQVMVGITAWQQQVPLPQNYRGDNAWRIPLKPELAETPVSAKEQLFRGAIALAANGVPIFNPIKNDGKTDTLIAGELDEFGGHCGRADDYHYHIAPTHLQKFVGKDAPIAYALDGFPIYGLFDPKAKHGDEKCCPLDSHEPLDWMNGHHAPAPAGSPPNTKGPYHYHASEKYPYLNGGMRGVVTVKDDQIDPQPRASSPRAALPPLRGAKITGFKEVADKSWSLEYTASGKPNFVNFRLENGKWIFDFVDAAGVTTTDTYDATTSPRRGGGGRGDADERPPRDERGGGRRGRQPKEDAAAAPSPASLPNAGLSLSSTDVTDGRLARDCTCDGSSRAPALAWTEPPKGTKSLAVVMHHVPPEGGAHVYMVVANIPASARELKGGDTKIGTWGQNTVNRKNEYAPPCSQGGGDKSYTITLYALSQDITLASGTRLTRDALLDSIKTTTVASTSIDLTYARAKAPAAKDQPKDQPNDAPQPQPPERRGQGRRGERPQQPADNADDQRGLIARMTAFKTDVPAHDSSLVLSSPTETSITLSLAAAYASEAVIEYWSEGSTERKRSARVQLKPGQPSELALTGLTPGTSYRYRLGRTTERDTAPTWGEESRFRTRPAPGSPFTFVVQADSHLDQGVEPAVYEQTLKNMLDSSPDLFIDLGDTFMTDKRGRDFQSALPQYDAQRYYLSRVAHSASLFMVLGNHDGEKGTSGSNAEDIGPWSYAQRTSRFPPPAIDGYMYTGKTDINKGVGANYYAFEWGDALFIMLDPYWSTTERIRGGGGRGNGGGGGGGGGGGDRPSDQPLKPLDTSWTSTLGEQQYQWLNATLAATNAKYRFVFIHHLVGGLGGPESRGGAESAPFFEWGGNNADGTPGFAEHRPGWALPIHDLLVKHHVSAVFHGHDHLYVRAERDGLIYQCIAQPGNPRGNTRTATTYGYASGTLLGSPGHLRVHVGPERASVAFIRTATPAATPNQDRGGRGRNEEAPGANGEAVHSYDILPAPTPSPAPARKPQ